MTKLSIEEKHPEVQLLLKGGREKGYLLYEEIHTVLSDEATAVPKDLESVYEVFVEADQKLRKGRDGRVRYSIVHLSIIWWWVRTIARLAEVVEL